MAGEAEMTSFANDTDRLIQNNEEHSWEQQVRTDGSHRTYRIESSFAYAPFKLFLLVQLLYLNNLSTISVT